MEASDFLWGVGFPPGMPVVPPYSRPWKRPEDLPSSRRCLGDVPRSSTPVDSPEPWPAGLLWYGLPWTKPRRHPQL